MKKFIFVTSFFCLFIFYSNFILACDLSEPDKIKHIKTSKNVTLKTIKVFSVPFIVLKPVKWLFNSEVQKLFPDNYLPHMLGATIVFTGSTLKEVPYDLLMPKKDSSYCDIVANCEGIKQGVFENK